MSDERVSDVASAVRHGEELSSVGLGGEWLAEITLEERALLNQIAIVRGSRGDDAGSIIAAEAAFAGYEPGNARESVSWLTYAMNLAVAYSEAHRHREAIDLHRRASDWARENLGPDHPQLLILERSHADALVRVGRFAEARDLLRAAAPAATRMQLPLHRVRHLRTRAVAALYSGQPEAALRDLVEADALAMEALRDVPGERAQVLADFAWALLELGAYAEAAQTVQALPQDAAPPPRIVLLRQALRLLGASPRVLARITACEVAILTAAGLVVAAALAFATLRIIQALGVRAGIAPEVLTLQAPAFLVALTAALVIVATVTAVASRRIARLPLAPYLKGTGKGTVTAGARSWPMAATIVAQVSGGARRPALAHNAGHDFHTTPHESGYGHGV